MVAFQRRLVGYVSPSMDSSIFDRAFLSITRHADTYIKIINGRQDTFVSGFFRHSEMSLIHSFDFFHLVSCSTDQVSSLIFLCRYLYKYSYQRNLSVHSFTIVTGDMQHQRNRSATSYKYCTSVPPKSHHVPRNRQKDFAGIGLSSRYYYY
jgi:hypothetical protein